MGRVLDKFRENRAKKTDITAVDSSTQVDNEEVKANNPTDGTVTESTIPPTKEEEAKATPTQEGNPINTEAIKTDIAQVDLSYKDNPQKDFFGVVQPVAQNKVETQAAEETPQTNASVQGNGTPTADDIIKGTWQKQNVPQGDIPDASQLTIVNDMKQANKGVGVPKIENNAPTEKMVKENPLAIGLEAYTMNQVIEKAKTMEGGLSKEGNIEKAMKELGVDNMRFDLDTIDNTYNGETITPRTQEAETPQATEEEEEKKQFGDDWLYEFSKVNPKPNVLADLGFHGFEKYNVPDNLLKLWGKDLTGAIDDIKDENGNHLTDEQKKRIKRRIRGVRAGQALMQIANIATQAAAVSQGGTPVKMDNSSILGKIHNQAQAKQDAWLKQALKAKETANKDKMDMLNYQLDLKKALWGKEDKDLTREIQKQKAILDWQRENRLISEFEYRMKKDALTFEEQKRHNKATENISQQRANTYANRNVAEKEFLNNYRHYNINGNDYVIPRTQQTILAGYLIDYINDTKNAKLKEGLSENLKNYLEGQTAEQTKKDAKQAELFIAQALGEIGEEVANVIINKNLRANDETSRAYLQLYANGYSPIANEATERGKESETDNDELEKRAN